MRPCNNRGAEAPTCIPHSKTNDYIFQIKEQSTNTIKVPVKLRSLIFILPLLLLSSVLQSLTASRYGQGGRRTHSLHAPCSIALSPPVEIAKRCVSVYPLKQLTD